ncbi:MAG: lipoyl(octanoyl) transferase LipB [Clostridia bacterium]|nr:lipoyl(octanoyl) transferase LipB [Clostridia bacterium]
MLINVAYLGKMEYGEALRLQERLLDLRHQGKTEDILLIVEHPPVLTVGRRGSDSNILLSRDILKGMGVEVFNVSRGGDVTYHGPGQIVGYPIMDLNNFGKDIKDFVWKVEEVFIRLLNKEFAIEAQRDEKKYTGVWVGNEKITAIGIAVKKWISMHGFAFNVNTDLSHFNWIVPCGITDKGVTSVQKLVGKPVDFEQLCRTVVSCFCEVFDVQPVHLAKQELYEIINLEGSAGG